MDNNPPEPAYDATQARLLQKLVRSVLREVWQEFYDWRKHDNDVAFLSLMNPPSSGRNMSLANWFPPPQRISPPDVPEALVASKSTEVDEFMVYNFDDLHSDTRVGESHTLALEVAPDIPACEPYECCLPSNRSRFVGDDSDYLPFIPFQSEEDFPHEQYAGEHKFFAWQNQDRGRDPNRKSSLQHAPLAAPHFPTSVEIICLETVKRLVRYHDLDVLDIETTGVLPLKLLKSGNGVGLLISLNRRYVGRLR